MSDPRDLATVGLARCAAPGPDAGLFRFGYLSRQPRTTLELRPDPLPDWQARLTPAGDSSVCHFPTPRRSLRRGPAPADHTLATGRDPRERPLSLSSTTL